MARSAFWTIIVDDQPTAFRAAVREDLLPTLKQLQRQHPTAAIKWFQRGRLWETPGDAMDASKPPRRGPGWRPGGEHKDPRAQYKVPRDVKRARWAAQAAEGRGPWVKGGSTGRRTSTEEGRPPRAERGQRPAWKPKVDGDRPPRPRTAESRTADGERRPWKPREDRPKGDRPAGGDRRAPSARRPAGGDRPAWKSDGDRPRPRSGQPRGERSGERQDRRPATPRQETKSAPPARKGRTWRAGELPPAERKKKKD